MDILKHSICNFEIRRYSNDFENNRSQNLKFSYIQLIASGGWHVSLQHKAPSQRRKDRNWFCIMSSGAVDLLLCSIYLQEREHGVHILVRAREIVCKQTRCHCGEVGAVARVDNGPQPNAPLIWSAWEIFYKAVVRRRESKIFTIVK